MFTASYHTPNIIVRPHTVLSSHILPADSDFHLSALLYPLLLITSPILIKMAAMAPPPPARSAAVPAGVQAELKAALRERKLYVMVGSGVTLNATRYADERGGSRAELSWNGFILAGLAKVEGTTQDVQVRAVCDHHRSAIASGVNDACLSAGQFIRKELDDVRYLSWLKEVFGPVPESVTDDRVLRVLRALTAKGGKLMTTNYDSLLERKVYTHGESVLPRDDNVVDFFDKQEESVYHIHGHYRSPDSIVIDFMQYQQANDDQWLSDSLKSVLLRDRVLFIGCGVEGGLQDPHIGPLWGWLQRAGPGQSRHTCLTWRKKEDGKKAPMPKIKGLTMLEYGDDVNNDLAGFIQRLFDLTDEECGGSVSLSPVPDAIAQKAGNGQP